MKAIIVTNQAAGLGGMKLAERPEPSAAINDVIVQIEACEELVFFENIVSDNRLVRCRAGIEFAQLIEAAHKKGKLCLESCARLALVEGFQERIFVRLAYPLRVQAFGQDARQRALANPDRPFYRYVAGEFKKFRHLCEVVAWQKRIAWISISGNCANS